MAKDLDRDLRFGFLVHDVSRLRRIVVDRALKPLGITRSQWWVLSFLSRRDGMTQTALAGDLDLTKVAIGGLIDRMENAGFVQRRADAADARARRVFLTKSGLSMVNTIRVNVEKVEVAIQADVADEDLDCASKVLVTLKETLLNLIGSDDSENADDFSLKVIEMSECSAA